MMPQLMCSAYLCKHPRNSHVRCEKNTCVFWNLYKINGILKLFNFYFNMIQTNYDKHNDS
jgi:hypothetical protein